MKGERLGEFEEFTLLAVRALGNNTYAVPIQQYVEKATARMRANSGDSSIDRRSRKLRTPPRPPSTNAMRQP